MQLIAPSAVECLRGGDADPAVGIASECIEKLLRF